MTLSELAEVSTAAIASSENPWMGAIALLLLVLQIPAAAILLARLLRGPGRYPPLTPQPPDSAFLGKVSIVVPTLNEAARIGPCLASLGRQSYEVREVLVVDSNSQDGTPDLVKAAQQMDPRFRLLTDDPLPPGWVGRPWALHTGFMHSSEQSDWVLGVDADTQLHPGLVASLLQTATTEGYDIVSLAPQFILKEPGEWWLQPALLMTLVYRFGAAGDTDNPAERVMANGQCFLSRRSVLATLGGYSSARNSFCDDVTLVRYAATQGAKVGFLDGSKLLKVRMYEGVAETWSGWGRSLDLKDAASPGQIWSDLWFLAAVQGAPVLLTVLLLSWVALGHTTWPVLAALGLNLCLLAIRFGLLLAIASSYDRTQGQGRWCLWLSPLADPLAVLRILLSSTQTSIQWRGRSYSQA